MKRTLSQCISDGVEYLDRHTTAFIGQSLEARLLDFKNFAIGPPAQGKCDLKMNFLVHWFG